MSAVRWLISLSVAGFICCHASEINIHADGEPNWQLMRRPLLRNDQEHMQLAPDDLSQMEIDDSANFRKADGYPMLEDLPVKPPAVKEVSDDIKISNVESPSLLQQTDSQDVASKSAVSFAKIRSMLSLTVGRLVHANGVYVLFIGFIVVFLILSAIAALSQSRQSGREATGSPERDTSTSQLGERLTDPATGERQMNRSPEGLDEDIYGMGIAVIIRDSQRLSMKTPLAALRCTRIGISVLVILFAMMLQVFIVYETKILVTAQSTRETRDIYDRFEIIMYGNTTEGLRTTSTGDHRGVESHFNISNFAKLDDDLKDSACQMPLSQPAFFIGVLLIWTFLCASEMRSALGLGMDLVIQTPTIDDMTESCKETPESGDEAVLVVGLTYKVKALITIFIVIPRLIVSCFLLWLGCRWLCGTMSFSDVMQNVVSLGFVIFLKKIFYTTMAPHHNKLETRNTLIVPTAKKQHPSAAMFLGTFFWGIMSIAWVILYIQVLQQVLPEYNWDIHDACKGYLEAAEKGTAT